MEMKLGPWPIGIDNLSPDEALPDGALRDALNVVLDSDGNVSAAGSLQLREPSAGLHSLCSFPSGAAFCFGQGKLFDCSSGALVGLADMPVDGPVACELLNGQLVMATRSGLFRLQGGQVEPMALPVPALRARPASAGGLYAGRYGVAISFRRGDEEGGLSRMQVVEVAEGGGIELDLPEVDGATAVSVYRTDANGAALYRALDAPLGFQSFLVGAGKLGAMPGTRFLEPLPGGHIVKAWMGRQLVASGRTLYYSAPLRYGLCNPAQDFIQFPSLIRMVLPVNDGIYLADSQHCYRLAGTDPEQWQLLPLDVSPPPVGATAVLDGSLFQDVPAVPVAVWLSDKGFVLGLPEGQLVLAQEKRLRLPMPGRGWLVADGHRLYAGG